MCTELVILSIHCILSCTVTYSQFPGIETQTTLWGQISAYYKDQFQAHLLSQGSSKGSNSRLFYSTSYYLQLCSLKIFPSTLLCDFGHWAPFVRSSDCLSYNLSIYSSDSKQVSSQTKLVEAAQVSELGRILRLLLVSKPRKCNQLECFHEGSQGNSSLGSTCCHFSSSPFSLPSLIFKMKKGSWKNTTSFSFYIKGLLCIWHCSGILSTLVFLTLIINRY